MKTETKNQTLLNNEMTEAAFNFWFNDQEHIRSPFPVYIRSEVKEKGLEQFVQWVNKVPMDVGKDITDEIVAEKFEEILFDVALPLVKTYDEKLTIQYPFLPRIGDAINDKSKPEENTESVIVDRLHVKRGDEAFMKIICRNNATQVEWTSEIELPE